MQAELGNNSNFVSGPRYPASPSLSNSPTHSLHFITDFHLLFGLVGADYF